MDGLLYICNLQRLKKYKSKKEKIVSHKRKIQSLMTLITSEFYKNVGDCILITFLPYLPSLQSFPYTPFDTNCY